jgi:hypothetical protein
MTLSGGPTPHVYGAMMVIPAPGVTKPPVFKQSGGGKLVYSSQGLQWANGQFGGTGTYTVLHWSYR